jgi:hypothetical protein
MYVSFYGPSQPGIQTVGNKTIRILLWSSLYSKPDWFGLGAEPFQKCPDSMHKNCVSMNNRDMYNTSDAILVHMRASDGYQRINELPKWRFPNQTWIVYIRESPVHAKMNYAPYNHVFNISATYKRSSEIYLTNCHV